MVACSWPLEACLGEVGRGVQQHEAQRACGAVDDHPPVRVGSGQRRQQCRHGVQGRHALAAAIAYGSDRAESSCEPAESLVGHAHLSFILTRYPKPYHATKETREFEVMGPESGLMK